MGRKLADQPVVPSTANTNRIPIIDLSEPNLALREKLITIDNIGTGTFAKLADANIFTNDQLLESSGSSISLRLTTWGNLVTDTPRITFTKADGSIGTPLPTSNDLLQITGRGFTGAGFVDGFAMIIRAPVPWTTISHPTTFEIQTTEIGSTAPTTHMIIKDDGEIDFQGNMVTGLATPTNTTDATTKDYVDTLSALAVQSSSNVGVGVGFALPKSLSNLPFRSLLTLNDEVFELNETASEIQLDYGQKVTVHPTLRRTIEAIPDTGLGYMFRGLGTGVLPSLNAELNSLTTNGLFKHHVTSAGTNVSASAGLGIAGCVMQSFNFDVSFKFRIPVSTFDNTVKAFIGFASDEIRGNENISNFAHVGVRVNTNGEFVISNGDGSDTTTGALIGADNNIHSVRITSLDNVNFTIQFDGGVIHTRTTFIPTQNQVLGLYCYIEDSTAPAGNQEIDIWFVAGSAIV